MLNPRKRFDCEFAELEALPCLGHSGRLRCRSRVIRTTTLVGPMGQVPPATRRRLPSRLRQGIRNRNLCEVVLPHLDCAHVRITLPVQGMTVPHRVRGRQGLPGSCKPPRLRKEQLAATWGGAPDRQRAFLVRVSQTTRIRNDGPLGQSGWRMPAPNRNREGDTHVTSTQDANPA